MMAKPKLYRTTQVKVDKELVDNLKLNFPKTPMRHLFNVMYNTSALRIEVALRNKQKK